MRLDVSDWMIQFQVMNHSSKLKPNFSEIGRKLNADPRTVKKYFQKEKNYRNGKTELVKPRKKHSSKLDPYKKVIQAKYNDGNTAMSIFYFIKDELGYQGGKTLVSDYCRTLKKKKLKKATVRVEVGPGDSAQVDWKEGITIITQDGTKITGNIFLYILAHSRFKYVEFTYKRDQRTFLNCLNHAFTSTGGIPEKIWFDNQKVVIDRARSTFTKRVFNETFIAHAHDAGFIPFLCRVGRPQTKGKIKSLAGLVDRLKVYSNEVIDAEDFASVVRRFSQKINYEKSQATGKPPIELWRKEKSIS